MASEVGICNLALSHLGDSASVSSIDPPEGSAQAEHCQRWYPLAVDAMLEMHDWSFMIKRAPLTQLTLPVSASSWQYAYAVPSDLMNYVGLYPFGYTNDTDLRDYVVETQADGTSIILTNEINAVLRYNSYTSDAGKFGPLFVTALSYLLASYLAGPVLKGESGRASSKEMLMLFGGQTGMGGWFGKATASDSNQKRQLQTARTQHTASWIAAR